MIVGQYAGQVTFDDCVYTAQDVVKLLAERDELIERLVKAGQDYYRVYYQLQELRGVTKEVIEILQRIPHSMLVVIRPSGTCVDGCPGCIAQKAAECLLHR